MRNYDFRKFTTQDVGLLRRWLGMAHVRAWWPNAETYLAQASADLINPAVDMRIVLLGGIPFAFARDFDIRAAKQAEFSDLPAGSRGLATFVGNPDFLGPGHAVGYIESRVRDLRQRFSLVAVGPNSTDTRSIAIFRQAGFHPRRLAGTNDGKLVQVMTRL